MNQRVNQIQVALEELNSPHQISIHAVAKAYNIPATTIMRRLDGGTTRRASHELE